MSRYIDEFARFLTENSQEELHNQTGTESSNAPVDPLDSAYRRALAKKTEQAREKNPSKGLAGDVGRALGASLNRMAGEAGYVGENVGRILDKARTLHPGIAGIVEAGERFAPEIQERTEGRQFELEAQMTPEYQAAREKTWFEQDGDGGLRELIKKAGQASPAINSIVQMVGDESLPTDFGEAWKDPRAYLDATVSSAPQMAISIGAGHRIVKGLLPLVKNRAAAAIIGYGAGEAGVAGSATGKEVVDAINEAPFSELAKMEPFQRAYHSTDENLSHEERLDLARTKVGWSAYLEFGGKAGGATAVMGAPSNILLGKILRGVGIARQAKKPGRLDPIKYAAVEAPSEVPQEGSEEYFGASGEKKHVDPTINPWQNVLEAGTAGGVAAALTSLVIGGGANISGRRQYAKVRKMITDIEGEIFNEDGSLKPEADADTIGIYMGLTGLSLEKWGQAGRPVVSPYLFEPEAVPEQIDDNNPDFLFEPMQTPAEVEKPVSGLGNIGGTLEARQAQQAPLDSIDQRMAELEAESDAKGSITPAQRTEYEELTRQRMELLAGAEQTPQQEATNDLSEVSGIGPEAREEVQTLRPQGVVEAAAQEAATSPTNGLPEPTEAQKEAGNYKKGKVRINGLDVSIENPAGSARKGVSEDGKAWETPIVHHYGYIKGTVGYDKDHLDVFLGPEAEGANTAYIVDQGKKDGTFDEHKVIIGASNEQHALDIYNSNYEAGWSGAKAVTPMPMEDFKVWAKGDGPKRGAISQPIQRKDGTPYKSESAAKKALKAQGVEQTHQITPVDGGFVLQPVAAVEETAQPEATTEGLSVGDKFTFDGMEHEFFDFEGGRISIADTETDSVTVFDTIEEFEQATGQKIAGVSTGVSNDQNIAAQNTVDDSLDAGQPTAAPEIANPPQDAQENQSVLGTTQPKQKSPKQLAAEERRNKIDPANDDILKAISKLGGIDFEQANSQWGKKITDDIKGLNARGVFGKPVLRKTKGVPLDRMREMLVERGYLKADNSTIEDLFDAVDRARTGEQVLSQQGEYNTEALEEAYYDSLELDGVEITDQEINDDGYNDLNDDEAAAVETLLSGPQRSEQDAEAGNQIWDDFLAELEAEDSASATGKSAEGDQGSQESGKTDQGQESAEPRVEKTDAGDQVVGIEGDTKPLEFGTTKTPPGARDVSTGDLMADMQGLEPSLFDAPPPMGGMNPKQAMEKVISEQTDIKAAMSRQGLGDISFYWGREGNPDKNFAGGYGVAKIIAKRTAEGGDGKAIAMKLVDVIARGKAGQEYGPQNGRRVNITLDGHAAVLSKHKDGDAEVWLLTGWENETPGGNAEGNSDSAYAQDRSGMRDIEGAGDDSNITPDTESVNPTPLETAPEQSEASGPTLLEARNMLIEARTLFESQRVGDDRVRERIQQLEALVKELEADQTASEKAEPAKPKYGEENKVFTKQDADAALAILMDTDTLGSNRLLDPKLMQAGITLAGYHIEAGARKFGDYAIAMRDALGQKFDLFKPYLKSWYVAVKADPATADWKMDEFDIAMNADVDYILFKADQVAKDQKSDILESPQPQEATDGDRIDQASEGESVRGVDRKPAGKGDRSPDAVESKDAQGAAEGQRTPTANTKGGTKSAQPDKRADGGRVPATRSGRDGAAGADPNAAGPGSNRPDRGGSKLEPQQIPGINYRIPADFEIKSGDAAKYNDNVAAIRTLKTLQAEKRNATAAEQQILAQYIGWGGLANAFRKPDGSIAKGWESRVAEVEELLSKEELEIARNSTQFAHYTSKEVVDGVWNIVNQLGFKQGHILEPSVGTGNFIGMAPDNVADNSRFTGVEYDPITAGITAALYPQSSIVKSGFEKVPIPNGYFDLVVGNPPFSKTSLAFKYQPHINRYSMHNQFMMAGIEALKPGGVQVFVVSRYFMDAKDASARTAISEKADLIAAYRLPYTAFKGNAGTEVITDIIVLKKKIPDALEKSFDAIPGGAQPAASWLTVGEVTDPLGGLPIPVNSYFVKNPNHIIGTLDRSGTQNIHSDVNVSLNPGQTITGELTRLIKTLPENTIETETGAEKSTKAMNDLRDSIAIALRGGEVGRITKNANGDMVQIYEKEGGDGDLFAERVITADSPWHNALQQDRDGNWYEVVDEKDASGKPIKAKVNGKTTTRNKKIRQVYKTEDQIPATRRLGQLGYDRLTDAIDVLDSLVEQINMETGGTATDAAIEKNRKKLRSLYEAFVKKHDYMNSPVISKLIDSLPNGALLRSLESKYEEAITPQKAKTGGKKARPAKATPSDILKQRIIYPYEAPTKADSVQDALAITLSEGGRVDIDRIAELSGQDAAAIIKELHDDTDTPAIFKDPETGQWEIASEYLGGNVVRKLEAARQAELEKNVAALTKVQPEPWSADKVTVSLGATWIPNSVYADFVAHLTGKRGHVSFSRLTNTFEVRGNSDNAQQWGSPRRNAVDLLSNILNSQTIRITNTVRNPDGSTTTTLDQEATQAANDMADLIKEEFNEWAFRDANRRAVLVDLFNQKFNVRVNKQRDGSHLKFPGKVPDHIIKLRRHQINAVWRGIIDKVVLYDHTVGSGKTFTAISRAMERRRMGLSRKPMMVVPNHIIEQVAKDVYALYPGAKVLAAGAKDLSRANRRRLFARIATGEWDLVIVPHSSFQFIGIAPETETAYLQQELAEAMEALEEARREHAESGGHFKPLTVKEAERLVQVVQARLDKIRDKGRSKDMLLTFEQMGVDDLTVDECFTHDTLIETDQGQLKIGDIVKNRMKVMVKSFDFKTRALQWKPVINWFENTRTTDLVEVRHERGSFVCTEGHNIWTPNGYREARNLVEGAQIYARSNNDCEGVPGMRAELSVSNDGQKEQREADLLRRELCEKGQLEEGRICRRVPKEDEENVGKLPHEGKEVAGIVGENEKKKSDEICSSEEEGLPSAQGKEVPDKEGRQRDGFDRAAGGPVAEDPKCSCRICCQNKTGMGSDGQTSAPLQDRHSHSGHDDSDRNRRVFPQRAPCKAAGREERQGFVLSRVESVTVLEPGSDGRYGQGSQEHRVVYDIEVADNHNYYANGVLVSNCHEFKNLFYNSRLNVRGMNPKSGSGKAYDLWTKIRLLRESGGSMAFMTGTPVSNSAVELYGIMRYLVPDQLAEMGLEHFDSWRNQFATVTLAFEPTESGRGLKEVNRIGRDWMNMRSLMDLYYSFADAVSNDDIKKWYAEDNPGQQFPIPNVKGGGRQAVNVNPTPYQEQIIDQIVAGFEGLKDISDIKERNAERLRLMDRARKVSLDSRAVDPMSPDPGTGGKLEKIAENVKRIYEASTKDKGTQLIFLDRSVPKTKGDEKKIRDYDKLVDQLEKAEANGTEDEVRRLTEQLEKYDSNEMAELKAAQQGAWNAYDQLKKNLIAQGIPEKEIRFVQEANTDDQKKLLFEEVNNGNVRVLIGSTPRMGAGTNVQERLVGLHHADVTWKPSDIEQREGRIIRQGNSLYAKYGPDKFEVEILAYTTERTVDAKLWSLNSTKLKMINGLRQYSGDFNMEFDDADSVGMAEIAAIASGNPLQLERVQLVSEIDRLQRQKTAHRRRIWGLQDDIERAENALEREKLLPQMEEDAKAWERVEAAANSRKVEIEVGDKKATFYFEEGSEAKALITDRAAAAEGKKGDFAAKINGKKYTSKTAAHDAIQKILGDANAFEAQFDGAAHIARSALDNALIEKIAAELEANVVEGEMEERSVGVISIGGIEFAITIQATDAGKGDVEVDLFIANGNINRRFGSAKGKPNLLGYKDIATNAAKGVASDTMRIARQVTNEVEYTRTAAAKAKEALPKLKELVKEPFSKAEELENREQRLQEVESELNAESKREGQESDEPTFSRAATADIASKRENLNALEQTAPDQGNANELEFLRRSISKYLGITLPRGAYVPGNMPSHPALVRLGTAFGQTIIPFRSKSKEGGYFDGVTLPGKSKHIFLNENASKPALTLFGHELVHQLRRNHPDLYGNLLAVANRQLPVVNVMKYKAIFDKQRKAEGHKESKYDAALEELLADFVGDQATDPSFWRQVAGYNPSVFGRIVDAVNTLIDRVLKAMKVRGLGSSKYFTDLESVRDAAAKVLAEYADRVANNVPSKIDLTGDPVYALNPDNDPAILERMKGNLYVPERLSEGTHEGNEGTSREAAAEAVASGSLRAIRQVNEISKSTWPEGEYRQIANQLLRPAEAQDIKAWAEKNGLMLDNDQFSTAWEKDGKRGGTEHDVYRNAEDGRWYKRQRFTMTDTFTDYFQRILLTNRLNQGVGQYRLEGFVENDGELQPVVSQADIVAVGSDPTIEEVNSFMNKAGFERVDKAGPDFMGQFRIPGENHIISDHYKGNVVRVANGRLAFLDPLIKPDIDSKRDRVDAEVLADKYGMGPLFSRKRPMERVDRIKNWAEQRADYLRLKFQDRFLPLKRAQELLERNGWKKTEDADAYLAEELSHEKSVVRIEKFQEGHVKPLTDEIKKQKLDIADVELYLYARHAPERNAYIQEINADFTEGGSGMTDAEAKRIMDAFEAAGKTAKLEKVAAKYDAITKFQRNVISSAGLETQETLGAWNRYEHYAPLKGVPVDVNDGFGSRNVGRGLDVRRSGTKQALGRRSEAYDIIGNTVGQAMDSIIRAEKSKIGNAFLNMVEQNPDPTMWKLYTKETLPTKSVLAKNPNYTRIKNQIIKLEKRINEAQDAEEMAQIREDLALLRQDLKFTPARQVMDIPDTNVMVAPNVLAVTRKGIVHYVEIQNEDLARVMKNLNPASTSKMVQAMGKVTRMLAMVNTSLNPEFVITNFERDIQTAMVNIAGEKSAKMAAMVLKGVPAAMKGIRHNLRSTKKPTDMSKWYDRFREAGGKVGYLDMVGVEEIQKRITKDIEAYHKNPTAKIARDHFMKALSFIEDYNTMVENAVRLSAFRVAVEAGASEAKAASLAKNLTVNFNRKGELGPAMNAAYMFFNAGVQGSTRIFQALKHKRTRKIAMGIVATAVAIAELNRAAGGEDDDGIDWWDKQSDYTKEMNLLFPTDDGGVFKIKLPYGYNVLVALGYAISDAGNYIASGGKKGKSPGAAMGFVANSFIGAFNPMGGDASALQFLAPTVVDPLVQMAENKNFWGGPIKPEPFPFGPPKPESEMYFSSVRPASKATAKWLNEITGGSQYEPGLVDISPEILDHFWDFATGGMGRFYSDSAGAIAATMAGDDVPTRRMPFKRHVVQDANTYYDTAQYREFRANTETQNRIYRDMRSMGQHEAAVAHLVKHPEITIRSLANTTDKNLSKINKAKRIIEANEAMDKRQKNAIIEELEAKQRREVKQFNKLYRELTQ